MSDPVQVRYQTLELGEMDLHVRSLRDLCQFNDDDGRAEAVGINSSVWPRFGVLWPPAVALAHLMLDHDISGRRILELGCGLALASLVLDARGADITATDHHPVVADFLTANIALNGARDIPFVRTGWGDPDSGLGVFDLIVASDVLYEREHADLLSAFIDRHADATCEVIIVDPGRGESARFTKRMVALGFAHEQTVAPVGSHTSTPFDGHVHTFKRAA